MIIVNTQEHPWHDAMTVQVLLDEKGYIFRHIIVRVNGEYVAEEDWARRMIRDGDDVVVLHLTAGG